MSESPIPDGVQHRDATTPPDVSADGELLIITGMSGAGKSRASSALQDLDWYVIDNLPPRLLITFASMMRAGDAMPRIAAVVDVRSREYFREIEEVMRNISSLGIKYRVLFLDASDEELVRRFDSSRRPHPLQGDGRLMDGIARERAMLKPLRDHADIVIDTTSTNVHDLARRVRELVSDEGDKKLRVTVMSFGFKHGLPMDADHVVDMRFLANPYWVNELRSLTGLDEDVSEYVLSRPGARDFVDGYVETLVPALDGYMEQLKPTVTIAVGCTGGRHRSVAVAEDISAQLRGRGFNVRTIHRDVGRE